MGDAVARHVVVGDEWSRVLLAASAIAARLAIGCLLHGLLGVAALANSERLPLGAFAARLDMHLGGALDFEPAHRLSVPGKNQAPRSWPQDKRGPDRYSLTGLTPSVRRCPLYKNEARPEFRPQPIRV